MNYKNLIYALTCLLFSIIIGGAVYEHMAVVPQWSAAVPRSLLMYQGEFGLNPGIFWQIVHPVTLVFFILTLIMNWKTSRRKNLLIAFVGYALILAVTAVYFVPELLELTATPFSQDVDAQLTARAKSWETLSIVRLVVLIALSLIMFLGLAKAPEHKA